MDEACYVILCRWVEGGHGWWRLSHLIDQRALLSQAKPAFSPMTSAFSKAKDRGQARGWDLCVCVFVCVYVCVCVCVCVCAWFFSIYNFSSLFMNAYKISEIETFFLREWRHQKYCLNLSGWKALKRRTMDFHLQCSWTYNFWMTWRKWIKFAFL